MEAGENHSSLHDYTYSLASSSSSCIPNSNSGSGNSFIHHSDTQFDSSTDETVIHYASGERSSRDFIISTTSIDRFDPEASPKSYLSRRTRRSIDTEQCGTLYEETLNVEVTQPLTLADYYKTRKSPNMAEDRFTSAELAEHERLVVSAETTQPSDNTTPAKNRRGKASAKRFKSGWLQLLAFISAHQCSWHIA